MNGKLSDDGRQDVPGEQFHGGAFRGECLQRLGSRDEEEQSSNQEARDGHLATGHTLPQFLQIPVLHAIDVQHRQRVRTNQTVQSQDDVNLEGGNKRAATEAKDLKDYPEDPSESLPLSIPVLLQVKGEAIEASPNLI